MGSALFRAALAALLFLACSATVSTAATSLEYAGETIVIDQPGSYVLANDIVDADPEVAIWIQSSNVDLDGGAHLIDGIDNQSTGGIYVHNETSAISNVRVRNVRVQDWTYGVYLHRATASRLEAISLSSNMYGAVGYQNATGATIVHCAVTDNNCGILLSDGCNETAITDCRVEQNINGVWVYRSDGVTLRTNWIRRNSGAGLTFNSAGGGVIYNNVFDNTLNIDFIGTSGPQNTWSVTPGTGPNIVGGPRVGGNSWRRPDGTGLSQIGPDADGDGFVDVALPIGDGSYDYYPLTDRSESPPPVTPTPTPTPTRTRTPVPTPTPLPEGAVPGRIEGERFDTGGEEVGYHDASPGNSGGAVCRTAEDVDIMLLEGGGYAVTGIEDGEWLAFTIDGVTDAGPYVSGPYPVELYVASDRDGRSVQVEVNGTAVRNVSVPNTGSLATFTPVLTQFGLAAQGRHAIRLRFHGDGQALDKVVFWGRRPAMYADGYAYPRFSANQTNGTAPLTVQFTDHSGQWVCRWHWSFGAGPGSEERDPVHTFRTPGTFTVSLSVSEESYWFKVGEGRFGWFNHFWDGQHPYGSETTTMQINVSGPVTAIPSGPSPPLDGDGDGMYEDVNGNGRRDFADVVLYYTQVFWIATNEPAAAFDYNGNGTIDFADVVWLFNRI